MGVFQNIDAPGLIESLGINKEKKN